MRMKTILGGGVLVAMMALGGFAVSLRAQAPATQDYSFVNIHIAQHQFEAGLRALNSDSYAKRQAASRELRSAMGSLTADLIKSYSPEQQARIAHLLVYQGDLTRWAISLLELPPKRRLAMLKWGLSPKMLPWVSAAFSHDSIQRAASAHPLGKIPGENTDWILERLLADSSRLVYITAMDSVWDRKPTLTMIQTIWHRAILAGFGPYVPPNNQRTAIFRGQPVQIQNFNNFWAQVQDGPLATRLLLHWKPAELSQLTVAYLAQICRNPGGQNLINMPTSLQAKDLTKLILATKPAHQTIPYLLYLVHRPMAPGQNINVNFNNVPNHFSNRTLPLYLLVKMANLKLNAYHLSRLVVYGNVWATGTLGQEESGIKRITTWYAKHGIKAITPIELKKSVTNTQIPSIERPGTQGPTFHAMPQAPVISK